VKRLRASCAIAAILAATLPAAAQIAMPDARQMSGIPRPVTDLPDRTVSVRLVRGSLTTNIPNHPVELIVNGRSETVRTGEDGRAQFGPLTAGATVKAVAVVAGERLESQEFAAPGQGGIRLMLVATDPQSAPTAPSRAAVPGEVTIGGDSRIVIELGDETLRVFYMLDIVNTRQEPVMPTTPFIFEAPTGALSTTVMPESSPLAAVTGTRVRVQGPFPPGTTSAEIGFVLPARSGSLTIEQQFPVRADQLGIIAEKTDAMRLSSPQIQRQQEMPLGDRTYIAAAVDPVPANATLTMTLDGLPHHSAAPRILVLSLAGIIVAIGVWAVRTPATPPQQTDRKRLMARREKLLQDLVRLETEERRGQIERGRYLPRREAIVSALEQIYRALDGDDRSPEPANRTGLAA
jgi:hypothetical protein